MGLNSDFVFVYWDTKLPLNSSDREKVYNLPLYFSTPNLDVGQLL